MVRKTKGEHVHRHPDNKKTISELIAAGQGNAIVPGDIMEKLYDNEAAEKAENDRRKKDLKRSKKHKKKRKKINRYVLESDSESDREFLEDRFGKEDSSGESDIQSADDEDALVRMYGAQSKFAKQKKAKREKEQAARDVKSRRRKLGEESIAFGFGAPVLEKKHDVKQNFKVPTWDDLDKAEANTSLSFGFGLVDSEAYISKDDPEDDVVKTIQETKNATDVSFSKSDQPKYLAKREDYWATKRERKSREKAFKRRERDKKILKQQRAKIKKRQEDLVQATRKLKRMKRATDEWIQNQLETQAAIVENRPRHNVLFEVTSYQSINRHPSFVGYRQQRVKYDVNMVSPMFWGYDINKIPIKPAVKASVVNESNRVNVEKLHPGSLPATIDYYDQDYQLENENGQFPPPPLNVEGTHTASDLIFTNIRDKNSSRGGSRSSKSRRKKKRKKRKTGAQMLAEYERKQNELEEKRLAKEKEEMNNAITKIRENFEELEKNHKHISFYGLFRKFNVKRARCNISVENPAFFNYIRDQRDEGESDEEEDAYEEFDIKLLEPFGSRCLICKARPGVTGHPGCPACFDLHEKMPHTYPKREDPDVYEPIYVRPQGIVSLEDLKNNKAINTENNGNKEKKNKKKKKKKRKKSDEEIEDVDVNINGDNIKTSNNKRFFRVGAYVEARVRGWEDHYLGKIVSKHKDGLFYEIEFENGEKHEDISCRRVRKIKKQRIRTSEKFSSDNLSVTVRKQKKASNTHPDKPKGGFSHHEEMARQAKKKMAWLSKMHTRLVDRSSILQFRQAEGYNPITLWIKSIPSGSLVRLVCTEDETVDEMIRLFNANSGEYGPESLGYFFLPTEIGFFFLDNTLDFPDELSIGYLPGDRKLKEYGIGAKDAGNEIAVVKVSAGGGRTAPNPRCVPRMALKYFRQNFSIVLGKQLRTDLIIRVLDQAPKALPAKDWVQHAIIRVVKDQLRAMENIQYIEKMKELEAANKIKTILYQKQKERMIKRKREKYRRETILLEARLANLIEYHVESEGILEEGKHNAEVRQVKNRLKTLKQKELKLERSLSHRRRRNEDEVPMFVFRKFKPKKPEIELGKEMKHLRYHGWKNTMARPFVIFAKKFPKATGALKKIGNKLFVNPAIKIKNKLVAIKKKLTPKIFGVWKEQFKEWYKNRYGKNIDDDDNENEEEKPFDEKDFLNMTKKQRSQVRSNVKKRLKQKRHKIAARKRALKDMKHENEIKLKYSTYRNEYHIPYAQVKSLAIHGQEEKFFV